MGTKSTDLSDDEAVAKMGDPVIMLSAGVFFCLQENESDAAS